MKASGSHLHLIAGIAWLACRAVDAAVFDATPSTYRAVLDRLRPGDTLRLAAGTYERGLPLADLRGTASDPIVIAGPQDLTAVFVAQPCCNTVQLTKSSHLVIRNLTLDGRNLDGPFGVDARGPCSDITLENLRIIRYGADLQDTAISTKGPAWGWKIRGNTILGAGTGLYLGNSDGTQPFVGGIIEDNVILDTRGYNMEIKHQGPRPVRIGLPDGVSRTIIRHNVFSKAQQGAAGSDARPNVLVGHFPVQGPGAEDHYEIYGNLFLENPDEALFQGEGNIALYDNVFINSRRDAVNIVPQHDRPRAIAVFHNTVVAHGRGISVFGVRAGFSASIFGNVVFAGLPITGPNQSNNTVAPYSVARDWLVAPFAQTGNIDLHPRAGRLVGSQMDPALVSQFTDAGYDFDGCVRTWRYRGAYDGPSPAGAWQLAPTPMPVSPRELHHVCSR